MTDTYAVVDKSKKMKRGIGPCTPSPEPGSVVYTEVNKKEKLAAKSLNVEDQDIYDIVSSSKVYYNIAGNTAVNCVSHYDSTGYSTYSHLNRNQHSQTTMAPYNTIRLESDVTQKVTGEVLLQKMCLRTWFIALIITNAACLVAVFVSFVLIAQLQSKIANYEEIKTTFEAFTTDTGKRLDNLHNSLNIEINGIKNQVNNLTIIHDRIFMLNLTTFSEISQHSINLTNRINDAFENISTELMLAEQDIKEEAINEGSISLNTVNSFREYMVHILQRSYVFESCASINTFDLPFLSGEYLIRIDDNNADRMNCTIYECDGEKGQWRRIAYLNINNSNASTCPSGFEHLDDPLSCRTNATSAGCSSVTYQINNNYKCVFGRITGYLNGTPDGFVRVNGGQSSNFTFNDNYVDGVTLTYGSLPEHIWSYAATISDCTIGCLSSTLLFNSSHYTCAAKNNCRVGGACRDHLLWSQNNCNGPSEFYRQLPESTSESVEMRVCRDEDRSNEEFLLALIEIYVA